MFGGNSTQRGGGALRWISIRQPHETSAQTAQPQFAAGRNRGVCGASAPAAAVQLRPWAWTAVEQLSHRCRGSVDREVGVTPSIRRTSSISRPRGIERRLPLDLLPALAHPPGLDELPMDVDGVVQVQQQAFAAIQKAETEKVVVDEGGPGIQHGVPQE